MVRIRDTKCIAKQKRKCVCTTAVWHLQNTLVFKTLSTAAMWDCDKCDKALAIDEDMWLESTDFDADAYSFCTTCWQNSTKSKTPMSEILPIALSRCGSLMRQREQPQVDIVKETRNVLLPNHRGPTQLTCRFISGSGRKLAEAMVAK